MEANDIGFFLSQRIGIVFEGLLVTPPVRDGGTWWRKGRDIAKLQTPKGFLAACTINDIPLRSVRSIQQRHDVGIEVYTLMGDGENNTEWEDEIDNWLARKWNVSASTVISFPMAGSLRSYLVANPDVRKVFVPSEGLAALIGPIAAVYPPDQPFNF